MRKYFLLLIMIFYGFCINIYSYNFLASPSAISSDIIIKLYKNPSSRIEYMEALISAIKLPAFPTIGEDEVFYFDETNKIRSCKFDNWVDHGLKAKTTLTLLKSSIFEILIGSKQIYDINELLSHFQSFLNRFEFYMSLATLDYNNFEFKYFNKGKKDSPVTKAIVGPIFRERLIRTIKSEPLKLTNFTEQVKSISEIITKLKIAISQLSCLIQNKDPRLFNLTTSSS